MPADVVSVYNMALAAIGTRARVQSPTEVSPEAEQCSLWYEEVRDLVLRSAPWNCASAFRRLALSSERQDEVWVPGAPAPGWRYAYALPGDFLAPRYLTDYAQFDLGVNSLDQKVLYTNSYQPILRYTKRQARPDLWDVDLRAAIVFALAAHIAPKLTGSSDKVRLVTAQAIDKIMAAREASANETQTYQESVPEWLVARGYGGLTPFTPYIYPQAEFTFAGLSTSVK